MFNKLCIIGVGLIGGSVARAARANGLAKTIIGYGREVDLINLKRAKTVGVIDDYILEWSPDCAFDCVVIATPVTSIDSIFTQLKPFWSEQTFYTDVGSTKGNVIAAAQRVFGDVPDNFIPAHPIAGAEQSGVDAAQVNLFTNKRLIITPAANARPYAVAKITQFWQGLGSLVSEMDAQHHDSILAATSHLPHLLAFALVNMLGHQDERQDIFKYAAGGFKDFTRIASSDPTMWKDICAANKSEILPLIEQLREELAELHEMLANDNYAQLFKTFVYANTARQRFLNQFDTRET